MSTWRVIPDSKWLITMVIVSPLTEAIPLPSGLRGFEMGVTNNLLTGMILQVGGKSSCFLSKAKVQQNPS